LNLSLLVYRAYSPSSTELLDSNNVDFPIEVSLLLYYKLGCNCFRLLGRHFGFSLHICLFTMTPEMRSKAVAIVDATV